jgi:hypothetical protein
MADSSERVFIRDNREDSLVRGISEIGGLWTSLSGIFAVVFGISLMRVLFGKSLATTAILRGTLSDPPLFKASNQ